MKRKDLEKIVLSMCQNDDTSTEIHHDLNGRIGLRVIKWWCQMNCQFGSIALSTPPCCPRFVGTKDNIQKVKYRLRRKKSVSTRKL